MKQKRTLTLMMACLMFVGCLRAQHATRHFISLNGSSGYVNTIRPNPALPILGLGGLSDNIGLGYQLHHNHLIFSVGVEFDNSLMVNTSKEEIVFLVPSGRFPKGMTEVLHTMNLNFPVMLGGQFGNFYFKAGVVPSATIYGNGAVIGPVLNDEHSVVWDKQDIVRYRYSRILQYYGRLELGGSFGSFTSFDDPQQPKARFYLGAYMDYGLMKDIPSQGIGSYTNFVPYAISNEGHNDVSIPINIGLRFTCLFHVGK